MHTFSCLFLRSLRIGLIGPELAFASCWHGHQWLWISSLCMLVQLLQHICHALIRFWRQVHWLLQLGLPPHSCASCPEQAQCQISTRLSYLSMYDNTSKHHSPKPTWSVFTVELFDLNYQLHKGTQSHKHIYKSKPKSKSYLVKHKVKDKYNRRVLLQLHDHASWKNRWRQEDKW